MRLLLLALGTSLAWEPLAPRPAPRPVVLCNLWDRCVPYATALAWQRQLLAERVEALREGRPLPPDVVLLMQHPTVLTLGRKSTLDNVLGDAPPFEVHRTERGGEVTYHGPGQLILYPFLNLREYRQDAHWYMRSLEEVVIRVLQAQGIVAGREDGLTGVWVEDAKVCAMGVKLTRWLTMHGLALNVDVDLAHFGHIVPCGIADKSVTSICQILADREMDTPLTAASPSAHVPDKAALEATQEELLRQFAEVFQVELIAESPEAITARLVGAVEEVNV